MRAEHYMAGAVALLAAFGASCSKTNASPAPAVTQQVFAAPCPSVWPGAVAVLRDAGFVLLHSDPSAGIGSFLWNDLRTVPTELGQLAVAAVGPEPRDIRITGARLILRASRGQCEATILLAYEGEMKRLLGKSTLAELRTTGTLERYLLASMAARPRPARRRKAAQFAAAAVSLPGRNRDAERQPVAVAALSAGADGSSYVRGATSVYRLPAP